MSVFQQPQEWLQTFIICTPLEIARETNSRMIMANFYLYVNVNNIVLFKEKSPKQHELQMTVIDILPKRTL